MKKNPRLYLLHIRDALKSIEEYSANGEKFFFSDERTQDAILFKLAIIGEAVKRPPKSLRDHHPEIPWKDIAGTRDIVIHEYDNTELPRIWNIVKNDVPVLKSTIKDLLGGKEDSL